MDWAYFNAAFWASTLLWVTVRGVASVWAAVRAVAS